MKPCDRLRSTGEPCTGFVHPSLQAIEQIVLAERATLFAEKRAGLEAVKQVVENYRELLRQGFEQKLAFTGDFDPFTNGHATVLSGRKE
jgi:hypothetical protein